MVHYLRLYLYVNYDTVLFCINQSGDPKPEVKWYRGRERDQSKKGDKRVR